MKKGAHRKFWGSVPYLAAAALSLMLLPSGPVNAGSCAIDSTCIFELTNSNVTELNGNIDIRVTINNTGASTVLSLQYISSNTADPLGLDKFGYNNAALVSSISGNVSDWTPFNTAGATYDGFGTFLSLQNSGPAETGGISGALNFTLNGLVTSFPENSNGAEFVTHIRYSGSCSGFVSDRAVWSRTPIVAAAAVLQVLQGILSRSRLHCFSSVQGCSVSSDGPGGNST